MPQSWRELYIVSLLIIIIIVVSINGCTLRFLCSGKTSSKRGKAKESGSDHQGKRNGETGAWYVFVNLSLLVLETYMCVICVQCTCK